MNYNPRAEAFFPCGPFTPNSKCGHTDKSILKFPQYCPVCHRSWADGSRELRIDAKDPLRRDDGTRGRRRP